jgi:hypothetical protein
VSVLKINNIYIIEHKFILFQSCIALNIHQKQRIMNKTRETYFGSKSNAYDLYFEGA